MSDFDRRGELSAQRTRSRSRRRSRINLIGGLEGDIGVSRAPEITPRRRLASPELLDWIALRQGVTVLRLVPKEETIMAYRIAGT